MQFGIYVEMQNPYNFHKSHAQLYRETIEQIEHADRAGFSTFSTLEHHWFEEFSISTNPLALYAAAAQRTKQIRFRTCSHVLPLHNPMVFAGQVAAADILTGGRIEMAFGRGHSWVFPKASIPLEDSRGLFVESMEILEKAWTQERFSHHGQYYNVENVSVVPRPLQSKFRLFAGGASNHNYQLAGEKGHGIVVAPMLPYSHVAEQVEIYRKACAEHGHKPDIVFIHAIYIDEDESKVHDNKEHILQYMAGNVSPSKDMPSREEMMAKDFAFYASGALEKLAELSYEQIVEEGYAWVGTPEQVAQQVETLLTQCPDLSEISVLCTYGGMDHWKTIRTQELFSQKVMPHFQNQASKKLVENI